MAKIKTALLCIDMQNDFVLPDAVLCVKGGIACVPHVMKAVETARVYGVPVIWVIREHHASGKPGFPSPLMLRCVDILLNRTRSPTTGIDVERFREHFYVDGPGATIAGTPGAALVDGLVPRGNELVIVKKRFSAFMHTHLDSVLRRMGVEHVVICGVQTPNCIRASAFDAVSLDFPQVSVLADATASATDVVQEANLFDLRNVGIATPNVSEWAASLESSDIP